MLVYWQKGVLQSINSRGTNDCTSDDSVKNIISQHGFFLLDYGGFI